MKLDQLKEKNYEFVKHVKCRAGCGESIELWKSPSGSWIAFNPMQRGSDEAVAHRTTCSEQISEQVEEQSKKKKKGK